MAAREASVCDTDKALNGLNGPSFFPRTIRASAHVPAEAEPKDLRGPQKLLNEAKKIVDGGAEVRDKRQERGSGLGVARKSPPFKLQRRFQIDPMPDPDEYFDEFERSEKARKELQKQLGIVKQYKPREPRPRREGILGKTYHYKHPYPSITAGDGGPELYDEAMVSWDNLSAPSDESEENLVLPDHKRAPYSYREKISFSHPSVNLETAFNIVYIEDPDEYFRAFERKEKAKKEIRKQLGIVEQYKPREPRPRREGILGKTYHYKHLYPSLIAGDGGPELYVEAMVSWDNPSALSDESKEKLVLQDIPSAPNDESQEKLVLPDHNHDANSEEFEPAAPVEKKTESKLNPLLEELMSCSDEFLEGDGVMNLLKERFGIKPLQSLSLSLDELRNPTKELLGLVADPKDMGTSIELDSDVVVGNTEPPIRNMDALEVMENTADHNPYKLAALEERYKCALLEFVLSCNNETLQADWAWNILKERFGINTRESLSPSLAEIRNPTKKLLGLVDAPKDTRTSIELDSDVVIGNAEPPIRNMDALEVVENTASLLEQLVDENSSIPMTSSDSRLNAFTTQLNDKLHEQVDAPTGFGLSNELESHVEVGKTEATVSYKDPEEVIKDADRLPQQFLDENASIQNTDAGRRPNKESDDSNPPVPEEEARDGTSSRHQIDPEQSPEVHAAKPHKRKRKAGEKHITNARTMRKNLAGRAHPSVFEEEDSGVTSSIRQSDLEKPPEVHTAKSLRGTGVKRIRDAHPMTKSLAEAGTTFENGARRSKRIRSRPLEFWKGERFVYERVDDGLKLTGVRYLSPGGKEHLKVKTYVS